MSTTAIPTPDPNSAAWSIYLDNQSFNLTGLDGTPVTLSLTDLNYYNYTGAVNTAAFAFSLGFAGMLLIVLLLMTDAKKLRRPIMLLNTFTLILFSIRSVAGVAVGLSPFYLNIGEGFLGAIAQYDLSVNAGGIVSILVQPVLYATILASLILQVRVVFGPEPRLRFLVTIFLSAFATVLVVFEITYAVYNLIEFLQVSIQPSKEPSWLYPLIKILLLVFLGLSSLIFLYKLAITIRMRRRLGLTRFGPLQILFIMSAQCLVVPRIPLYHFTNNQSSSTYSPTPSSQSCN
jgi:pheromone alpha factor receptor